MQIGPADEDLVWFLTDLVGQCLRWLGDMAIQSFRLDCGLIRRGILVKIVHHLFPCPVLMMNTGIHHEAYRTQ